MGTRNRLLGSNFIRIHVGSTSAIEFASGYVLEQSLSIDNLFVFLVLFDFFKVEKSSQDRVLGYGLFAAVLLRGLFIGIGFTALENFHQVLLIFAGILLVSSYKILFSGEDEEDDVRLLDMCFLSSKNY